MLDSMTAQEWARLLPELHEPASTATEVGDILQEMTSARFVDVVSAVFLPRAWLGIVEPEEDIQEQIIARVGRWCVTTQGLVCVDEDYWISADRLDEGDWLEHLLEKDWLYDPSDLILAFEQAREHLLPNEDRVQRTAAIDTEIRQAITAGHVVFDPTVLRRHHIYLVPRMRPEERAAFCAFLADAGFVARP
jgi:hypothetical protein